MSPNSPSKSSFSRRKIAKQLSYRFRHKELTSHEQVQAKAWKKLFYVSLLMSFSNESVKDLFMIPAIKYFSIVLEDFENSVEVERPLRKVVSINSFTPSTAKMFFKFQKVHLYRLIELFNFPATCKLCNDGSTSGEDVFLRGLYEL